MSLGREMEERKESSCRERGGEVRGGGRGERGRSADKGEMQM